MSKKILMVIVLCLVILNPIRVVALSQPILISHHSYELEAETPSINNSNEKDDETKFSILGALKYRLFEKDTRDGWDYLLLSTFIVGLLIVMVFKNTRYYYVKIPKEKNIIKLDDNDVDLVEKIDPKKRVQNSNYYKRKNYNKKDKQ